MKIWKNDVKKVQKICFDFTLILHGSNCVSYACFMAQFCTLALLALPFLTYICIEQLFGNWGYKVSIMLKNVDFLYSGSVSTE